MDAREPYRAVLASLKGPLRIIVCGGREYKDKYGLSVVLTDLNEQHGLSCVITGAAPGADTLALEWARANEITFIGIPAQWRKFLKKAGPLRNRHMASQGRAHLLLAFPGGAGTADMIKAAAEHSIPVIQAAP